MRVLIQPCSDTKALNNLERTIKHNINLDEIKPFISPAQYKILLQIYPHKKCFIWGTMLKNINSWNKLQRGDVAVFTGNNKIFLKATVTFKIQNTKLANYLWGKDANQT